LDWGAIFGMVMVKKKLDGIFKVSARGSGTKQIETGCYHSML
jgi:hypothetical protein